MGPCFRKGTTRRSVWRGSNLTFPFQSAASPKTNRPGKKPYPHALCSGHRSGHHVLARHRLPRRHLHRRSSPPAEFPQHFPASGWVEHEPEDIWTTTVTTCRDALEKAGLQAKDIAAIGITNQRETTVVWDRATGQAIHRAIVWQDRRTRTSAPD